MIPYDQLLTQRQQEATTEEEALVRHFGRDAEDCSNWQRLIESSWLTQLTNGPGPKMLVDEEGCYLGINEWDGETCPIASDPSLYSSKFPYVFAKRLANGGPALAAYFTQILEYADEIDCDQLSRIVDTIITYLNSYTLRALTGSGYTQPFKAPVQSAENFMHLWDEEGADSSVFICRFGVAVPGHPVIPFEVATKTLRVIERQIEACRQSLIAEFQSLNIEQEYTLTAHTPAQPETSADDVAETQVSKLFRKLTPADCHSLAVAVGFIYPNRKPKGSGGPSKIWGMVETLMWHQFADPGARGDLVRAIARLYRVKIADNFTPDGLSNVRKTARKITNTWLSNEKKIDEAARKQFNDIHYNSRLAASQTDD